MSGAIGTQKAYQVIKKINLVMCYVVGAGVLALTGVTLFEMVARFGFGRPTVWTLDISRYLLLLVGVLALPHTMQEDAHVYFRVLVDAVPLGGARRIMTLTATLLGLIFCGVLVFFSVKLSVLAFQKGWGTMAHASIPLFYLYILMAIGALMLSLTYILKTVIEVFLPQDVKAES